MKKTLSKEIFSEKKIIKKFFKKLTFNKYGTFFLENDAAFLNISRKYKLIVTTDTINENIDFFSNDPPESIAQKLVCINLSDLSAMGSLPKAYTLNLSINNKVDDIWLKKFTKRLFLLEKKYNFYLLGGDISKSNEINLSATFFGQAKLKNILSQNKCSFNEDIWITGNLGNSFLGYNIIKNPNLKIGKNKSELFKNKYLYPQPCLFGFLASKYISCAIDISDGFYGDLSKLLNNNFGAKLNINNIPVSNDLKKVLFHNPKIKLDDIFNWGDDYELLFSSKKIYRNKILNLAKINNIKLTKVGSIIKKRGIYDDSMNLIKNISSYDHFC